VGVVFGSESFSRPVSFSFSTTETDADDAPGRETHTDIVFGGVTFSVLSAAATATV
jgi:hypothetical protein